MHSLLAQQQTQARKGRAPAPNAPPAPCPAPCRGLAGRVARRPSWLALLPQYTRLYCDTVLNPPSCLSYNTISCIAIQFSSQPTTHPCNTICCIAIQLPTKPSCLLQHNFCVLQYNFPPMLQYNPAPLALHFHLSCSL